MHNCEHEHCNHQHGNCGHHHGEGCHNHEHGHQCHHGEKEGCQWGGKREGAGRKCENPKIPFNRRLSEESINKIKTYAAENNITETEALERAIKNL